MATAVCVCRVEDEDPEYPAILVYCDSCKVHCWLGGDDASVLDGLAVLCRQCLAEALGPERRANQLIGNIHQPGRPACADHADEARRAAIRLLDQFTNRGSN